jgi:hypothetical protein
MAIAPILFLIVANLSQTKPDVALRSIVISFAVATLLWGGLGILIKDWERAAFITTLLVVLFYTYGHVYELLRQVSISGVTLGRHRYLGPTWFFLLLIGAWLILTRLKNPTRVTEALNFSAGVAIAIPLVQLILFESQLPFSNTNAEAAANRIGLSWEGSGAPPDIYYIMLDAYTGEDALRKTYGFDNRPFLDELSKLGFYLPSCTQSNYAQTEHTLASTLNLSYLDELGDGFVADSDDRSGMWPLIRHSAVRQMLEELGYSTVAFDTGFRWSELDDADYYFDAATGPVRGLSAFEATLLRTTAAWILVDQLERLPPFLDSGRSAEEHYRRVSYVLDQLREAPALAGSNFIFAHIVSPHLPFVFGPEGEFLPNDPPEDERNMDWYIKGYVDQVGVLNSKVLTALEHIIAQSEPSPVIVLVGDHGPEMGSDSDRMSILYGVLLPGVGEDTSDQLNSPVNSFRVIFNSLFGTAFPILDHASLFSTYPAPYDYTLITNDCFADTTANHHP